MLARLSTLQRGSANISLQTQCKYITRYQFSIDKIIRDEFKPSTIIEPFRIKMVEPINMLTRSERESHLQEANYNVFKLHGDHVTIDLMTDSGTSAMSQEQWSKLIIGDETYARAKSWYKFRDSVQSLTNKKYIFPVHQGRAAERLLFGSILQNKNRTPADEYIQQYVPGNTHFDTTRANIEYVGANALDMVIPEGISLCI